MASTRTTMTVGAAPEVALARVEQVATDHAVSPVDRQHAGALLRRDDAWVVRFEWANRFDRHLGGSVSQVVRITVEPDGRGGTDITVQTSIASLIDFGQGKRLATRLINAISEGLPA